ncbi:MAG: NUDIX domain-containing protein [Reichenbachiella sp.]
MGLHIKDDKMLLINHSGLNKADELWLPPGGGVDFGMTSEDALKKEFLEELNVEAEIGQFLFLNEFISGDFHAIELFFEVKKISGIIALGHDPELNELQIIQGCKYMSIEEIKGKKKNRIHSVFRSIKNLQELLDYKGFYNFENII